MSIAKMIDHTLLKPDATSAQMETLCAEAREYGFYSVCVNPCHVPLCAGLLRGSGSCICTVAGFPLGASTPEIKALEAERAVRDGAAEIDMVLCIGALKDRRLGDVRSEIAQVVRAAGNASVKVILETCLLTDDEIVNACLTAREAGAHFVKTSTGFAGAGADLHHVALMRKTVGPNMGVKAAGGIRDYSAACAMLNAGANRIGSSAGILIVRQEAEADLTE